MNRKNLYFVAFAVVIVVAASVSVVVMSPIDDLANGIFPEVVAFSATWGGTPGGYYNNTSYNGSSSNIRVIFNTEKPIGKELSLNNSYMIIQQSGRKASILEVPIAGPLMGRPIVGKTTGFFVIDNGAFFIRNDTLLTIVIGGHPFTNMTIGVGLIYENGVASHPSGPAGHTAMDALSLPSLRTDRALRCPS